MKTMKYLRYILLFQLFFFLFSLKGFGQIVEQFPEDSAKFIKTYSEYMEGKISNSKKDIFERFYESWTTGKFEPEKRDSIIFIANRLLSIRAKREPHFITMMDFFTHQDSIGISDRHFPVWMKSFRYAASRPKGKLKTVMKTFNFTTDFFISSILFSSQTRTWIASDRNYEFTFDTTLKIIYKNTDLLCRFREDSIQIFNTSGTFYPFTNMWHGQNGKVTWERAGYSKENIYAELSDYEIQMTKAEYKADSVKFVNKLYFDQPVMGRMQDKLVHIIKPQSAIYPVFNSYKNIFEIKNIYENMNFTGGFTMKGSQFIGSGSENKEALIHVEKDDQLFMTIEAQLFVLQKTKAVSRNASVVVHLGQDSIFHTGLQFNYYVNSNEIEFTSNDNVLSESVYYNSYHNLSMKFDRLLWKTTENKIYFTYGRNKNIGNATFTSTNYFTLEKWNELEMRDEMHPLIAIRNYAQKVNSRKFDIKEYAKYVRKATYMVKNRLVPLAKDGFIFYDMDNDTISINDKLYDYISSRIDKIDYDVIRLQSSTESPQHSGILDLSTMELNIHGVPRIHLSDSQDVTIYPANQEIIMKKNRDFHFAGVVDAGLFTFYGQNYDFSYDQFKIELDSIDSLNIQFQTGEMDDYGEAVLARVKNTINDLSGDIYIDKPDNKSGKDYYPTYPKFESKQKSYVYYDNLFNGPYKRENFYFELYPFQMDSLDNFNPKNLKFKGNFHSADIFPPFEETLKLRDDRSMGFVKNTPEDGYPLYEGKGKYFNTIDMSNRGLKGKGRLTYLTADMSTDDILFFPDSTSIHTNEFKIKQKTTGIEYPRVHSKGVNVKWYPHEDYMNINKTGSDFVMFDEEYQLNGNMTLKPSGLTANGTLDMSKAVLESNRYTFKSRQFDADTADLTLRTLDKKDIAFTADKLDTRINLDYQRGTFRTIENYEKTEFPQNLYIAYLDKFTWKMDENALDIKSFPQPEKTYQREDEMESLKDFDAQGVLFVSKHGNQDSLRFISTEADYTIGDKTLKAKKVDSLYIADAKIIPEKGLITVKENASMDTLRNSEVIANRNSRYHNFFDSKLKIKGRNDYTGQGSYYYVDKNDSKQLIHFDQITVDKSTNTNAKGTIAHLDSFTLSPNFRYRGDAFIKSPRKHLEFKGGVRLFHDCPTIKPRYTYFESVINPEDIYIPIGENLMDLNRRKVFVGSYITIDTTHIYSTFLTPRKDPSDNPIISSKGYLKADDYANKYHIAEKHKLNNPDTIGPMISLDKKYCIYNAEGKMNLGVDFNKMTIEPAGRLDHNLPENDIKVELTLPVDFLFSKDALDTMINDIVARENLKTINLDSRYFQKNLNEIYGTENTNKYLKQVKLYKEKAEIPKEFNNTILFSDIDFRWNTSSNSYIAQGDIGIALINGKPINKYVDGYVEIIKQRGGDRIYMYLKLDEERFYFFYYFRGMLRTWSDNKTFTKAIDEVPLRKRTIRDGWFSPTEYRYLLSTSNSFSRFMKRKKEVENELRMKEEQENQQTPQNKEPEKQESPDEENQTKEDSEETEKNNKEEGNK